MRWIIIIYGMCLVMVLFSANIAYNESVRASEAVDMSEALRGSLEAYFRTKAGKIDLAYKCVRR